MLGSTPNHCLTRGQRFKCSVKFARQKEDVPSILQDTWQHIHSTDSHSTAASSSQETRPSDGRTFSTRPKLRLLHRAKAASLSQKTRPSKDRIFSTRPKSRLPHGVTVALSSQKMHPYRRRVFKAVSPLRPQNWRVVLASAIQFKSTLAQADDCPPLV